MILSVAIQETQNHRLMISQFMTFVYRSFAILVVSSCIYSVAFSQRLDSLALKDISISFSDQINDFIQLHPRSVLTFRPTTKTNSSIMLPSTTMDHTAPLFCRLEDKINAGNKIKCLFRLGSLSIFIN
ncbi:hypothetical protein KUV50_03635 [Membranicola marinus]|uniref:Uncharacterized protein n=1 Tax=Membranihabitans marinus TaxID=1227546 RepID=A0A953HSQ1_9BACT|nr:hypothetical protein [Membranihabitans marinus]MBY5957213.1 hypothetical protein [Membranihabitans marinus]